MGTKHFFISHSGPDKPLAVGIKDSLDGNAWVDLHEIELGDLLLEEISRGIESATDFVVLWSAASASSRWVQFEFNMAFVRWIGDQSIAIRIVRLDDTPVPLYFSPFLQERKATSASDIAAVLLGSPGRPAARRHFVNRNAEIGSIEDAIHSSEISTLWIHGISGAGKRALSLEASRRLISGTASSRQIRVAQGVAEPELHLLVASALGLNAGEDLRDIDSISEITSERIDAFAGSGGIWIFEEAQDWLEEDGSLGRMAVRVSTALGRSSDLTGRLAIFTSRRKPRFGGQWARSGVAMQLGGLAAMHAVPLLRFMGADGDDEQLGDVARELDGHPLALSIIAPQLPVSATELVQFRLKVATDLIPDSTLSKNAWSLLEVLAIVDGPFPVENLAEQLGFDPAEIGAAIAEAVSYSLIEFAQSSNLSLRPLVRDYFLRSFRKRPDSARITSALAEVSAERLSHTSPTVPTFVPALLATSKLLGMAGKFEQARALRAGLFGTMFATATELYQQKRYEDALPYIEEAITGNADLDRDALLLKAKTLAYVGRIDEARVIGDQLVGDSPQNPRVLRDRGRVEFIVGEWDAALSFFDRALRIRPNNPSVLSAIAQVQIRLKNWDAAGASAKRAIEIGGDTPYTLSLYSQVLEEKGVLDQAQTMIERAVQREPRNPAYRHRLGRIAQKRGDRSTALQQFKKSTALDPTYGESWLSLASLLADSGDFVGADSALDAVSRLPGISMPVLLNLQAKVALLKGNVAEADSLVALALKARRDSRNLMLAIAVKIQAGETSILSVSEVRAEVKILARELDSRGDLGDLTATAAKYPQYF